MKRAEWAAMVMLVLLFGACEKSIQITVICRNEIGQPVEGVSVSLDEQPVGVSAADGTVSLTMPRPDRARILLKAEREGFYPLEREVALPVEEEARYSLLLTEQRFLEVVCLAPHPEDAGTIAPLPGVNVRLNGQEIGQTDEQGRLVYEFQAKIGEDLELEAYLEEYSPTTLLPEWVPVTVGRNRYRRELRFEPQVEQSTMEVQVRVVQPVDGVPIEGVAILSAEEGLGTTGSDGRAEVRLQAPEGAKVNLALKKPGYLFNPETAEYIMRGRSRRILKAHGATGGVTPPPPIHDPRVFRIATKLDFFSEPKAGIDRQRWETIINGDLDSYFRESRYLRKVPLGRVRPESGWNPGQAGLDYCLQVAVRAGETLSMEVQLLSPRGRPRIRKVFEGFPADDLRYVLSEVVQQLQISFPVEGVVRNSRQGEVYLNIGADRGLMEGDVMVDRRSKASAQVVEVQARTARARIKEGGFRVNTHVVRRTSLPDVGEQIVLELTLQEEAEEPQPLEGVSAYVDGRWAGRSDARGKLSILVPKGRSYRLELSKLGYRPLQKTLKHSKPAERSFDLALDYSLLEVRSVPSGSRVYLDDVLVGTTPLSERFAVGFYHLKVVPRDRERFRTWVSNRKLGLFRGSQTREIQHSGDYLGKGQELEAAGRFDEALRMFVMVDRPADKLQIDDYVEAQFAIGRIHLQQTGMHVRAAEAFQRVVDLDERYALAHLNLGLALHKARRFAESARRMELARRYEKHLPRGIYDRALADIYYTWALSLQRLSEQEENAERAERHRQEACRKWQEFEERLEGIADPHVEELRGMAASHRLASCRRDGPSSSS